MGGPPGGDQLPPLEEHANIEKAPVNPSPLTDGDIRVAIIQLAQVVTTQAQTMKTQANREVAPRPNQQVITVASHLRDFTRMNPPTF